MYGKDEPKPKDRDSWPRWLLQQGPAWITAITGAVVALALGAGVGYGASKVQQSEPRPTVTVTARPTVTVTATTGSTGTQASPPTNSSSSTPLTTQLPVGQAFTKGSFTISDSGVDLDRNPVESGNVSTGSSEITAEYPTGLYFYGAQDTAQWKQPGVPTQSECHNAEISDGVANLNYDLTSVQQSGQQARFCILTNEGRDAYVVIPGKTIVSSNPFPAEAFVWTMKIPVS